MFFEYVYAMKVVASAGGYPVFDWQQVVTSRRITNYLRDKIHPNMHETSEFSKFIVNTLKVWHGISLTHQRLDLARAVIWSEERASIDNHLGVDTNRHAF